MIYTPHPNFPRIYLLRSHSHNDSHTPNSITTLNPTTKVNHNGSSSLPCMKQQFYVPAPFPCMYVAL